MYGRKNMHKGFGLERLREKISSRIYALIGLEGTDWKGVD
jgi:hypothetical protein